MKILLLFSGLIFFTPIFSQNPSRIDSLLGIIKSTKIDTSRIRVFLELGNLYLSSDPSTALTYTREGINLGKSGNHTNMLPDLYFNLGQCYQHLGNNDSALFYLKSALQMGASANNTVLQAKSLHMIGYINTGLSDFKEASANLFKGLQFAETSGDKRLVGSIYSAISGMFYSQANYDKGIFYGEKALAILIRMDDPKKLGTVYMNVGLIYADQKKYYKAEEYYKQALKCFEKVNAKMHIATTYGNLSNLRIFTLSKKIEYLLMAQKIWDETAPDYPNAIGNMGNLGVAFSNAAIDSNFKSLEVGGKFISTNKAILDESEKLLQIACERCKTVGFDRDLHFFTGQLAAVEEAKGNFKFATTLLHEYITLNDSIYSQENKNKIAALETEREVGIRDKQLELNKVSLKNQRRQVLGLIAGILLLSIIGMLLYWQSRIRKKTNATLIALNTRLDEANKIKAKFFGIISHDLRAPVSNLVNYLSLQREQPALFSRDQATSHESSIQTAAESLLDTMGAMLQWSKSQMDHFKPQTKGISIRYLFDHIHNNFPDAENLKLEFLNPSGVELFTDEDYLKTIMQNLTANAVKALRNSASGKIEWKAFKEKGNVVMTISDNGAGVTEQDLEALYQDDAEVKSRNGLGLHIIRDLAKAINCGISFTSEPGRGTTFKLSFV